MSQTGLKNMLGTRQEVRIEEEWTIPLPAVVSVLANVITFAAVSLSNPGITVNMLAGQEIWVLDDFAHTTVWKGVVLHVVSNTTNTITVEETVEGTGIWPEYEGLGTDLGDVSDRLCVTQRGIRPGRVDITMYDYLGALGATGTGDFTRYTLNTLYGIIDETDLPDPVNTGEEKFAHGSANMPRRHVYVHHGTDYDGSWPMSMVWGRYLFPTFGKTVDEASVFDSATDPITCDVYPGEMVIEVAVAADFTVGDYIELGNHNDVPLAGTDSEIRLIVDIPVTGVTPDYIVVDKPFRRIHAVAAGMVISEISSTCYERAFASAAYIQHAMTVDNPLYYYSLGVIKKGTWDDDTQQDFHLTYLGHVFPEFTISSATDKEMTADISSNGLYAELDETGWSSPAAISRTYLYDSSSNALQPIHFSRGYITLAGNRWHQLENFELKLTKDMETKRAHTFIEKSAGTEGDGLKGGKEPWIHIPGRVNMEFSFDMPLHNKQLWNLIRSRSNLTYTLVYEILRSTTFTETWTFTLTDAPLLEGGTKLPATPTESQTITGPPENLSLTILDKTPYY